MPFGRPLQPTRGMDAFFAAVEQRDDPSLRGKPVIVGADPKGGKGRGVVSTCSYEARKFGVRSAMPISEAWRRCPQGVFVTPDFGRYSAASKIIHRIFYDFTPDIEPISVDEAFLDITNSYKAVRLAAGRGAPDKGAHQSEDRAHGLGGAGPDQDGGQDSVRSQKPDGLVEVKAGRSGNFKAAGHRAHLGPMRPQDANVMREHGIHTIGQLAQTSASELRRLFGSTAPDSANWLWAMTTGKCSWGRSQIPSATNILSRTDTRTSGSSRSALALCDKVSSRLRADALKAAR